MPSLKERRGAASHLPNLDGSCLSARRALQHEILLDTAAKNGRSCPPTVSPFSLPTGNVQFTTPDSGNGWSLGSWSPRNMAAKGALKERNAPVQSRLHNMINSTGLSAQLVSKETPPKPSLKLGVSMSMGRVEGNLKENKGFFELPRSNSEFKGTPQSPGSGFTFARLSPKSHSPKRFPTSPYLPSPNGGSVSSLAQKIQFVSPVSPMFRVPRTLKPIKAPKPEAGLLYLFSKQEREAAAACFKILDIHRDSREESPEHSSDEEGQIGEVTNNTSKS